MNKPDWKDAPEWAMWLAKDFDGQWWWHDTKPSLDEDNEWFGSERFKSALRTGDNENYRESLEPRP